MTAPAGEVPGGEVPGGAAAFIRAHTRVAAPPLLPEIALHLRGDEPVGLWEQTESETGRTDLPPPFWAYPWAGGIALARYLLDHREEVAGRVVLDLAAGSGLVAITALLAGAERAVANDIDPMSEAAIGLNAAVNGVSVAVITRDLVGAAQAGAAAPLLAPAEAGPAGAVAPGVGGPVADLMLVGDAFYERRMAHRMLAFLRQARSGGARVLIGDPGRMYLPTAGLRALACYAVPVWAGLEDTEIKQTTVWELS